MKIQTFNDGLIDIYSIGNIAEKGDRPKDGLLEKRKGIRYEERTVGMGRYWTAVQANAKVSQLLRVPRTSLDTGDVAVPNDGNQYKIVQIQTVKEVRPPIMDISLERIDKPYEFKTI